MTTTHPNDVRVVGALPVGCPAHHHKIQKELCPLNTPHLEPNPARRTRGNFPKGIRRESQACSRSEPTFLPLRKERSRENMAKTAVVDIVG